MSGITVINEILKTPIPNRDALISALALRAETKWYHQEQFRQSTLETDQSTHQDTSKGDQYISQHKHDRTLSGEQWLAWTQYTSMGHRKIDVMCHDV